MWSTPCKGPGQPPVRSRARLLFQGDSGGQHPRGLEAFRSTAPGETAGQLATGWEAERARQERQVAARWKGVLGDHKGGWPLWTHQEIPNGRGVTLFAVRRRSFWNTNRRSVAVQVGSSRMGSAGDMHHHHDDCPQEQRLLHSLPTALQAGMCPALLSPSSSGLVVSPSAQDCSAVPACLRAPRHRAPA